MAITKADTDARGADPDTETGTGPYPDRTWAVSRASVGRKVVMAVTGLILLGYVAVHLLGNLQLYMSERAINSYGEFLHSRPGFLWAIRVFLLAAFLLHIYTGVTLWIEDQRARPQRYVYRKYVQATLSSRTMLWGGLFVLAFVVVHVLHLTMGRIDGAEFIPGGVYHNVVFGFRHPAIAAAYIVGLVFLLLHLDHGVQSMLLTLGFRNPRFQTAVRRTCRVLAWLIGIANISFPLAVLLGLVG